ncbi:ferredoxin, partial [Nitrososphaera sp. AFS]|uniref:ferredoxin n=1 Tax=Nitrososphaera sp. AFS TaxID=2301191 RepID=UPI001392395B
MDNVIRDCEKGGVYPLHASRLGIFRLPVELIDFSDISSVSNDLKSSGFKMDSYADRIYATHKWTESGLDPLTQRKLSADLYVTVEIVTGEVVDLIYQIKPLEFFGDCYWVRNYRQKADNYAKMIIDTAIRNTKIGDKLIAHYQKAEKISLESAIRNLESLTPLAHNPKPRSATAVPPASVPAVPPKAPEPSAEVAPKVQLAAMGPDSTISLSGTGTNYSKQEGPIDPDFKSKRQVVGTF